MKSFPKRHWKKLVRIEWYDIATSGGWSRNTSEFTPLLIETVGWVSSIYKNKQGQEGVTISASQGVDNGATEYNQHISIPVSVITKVESI